MRLGAVRRREEEDPLARVAQAAELHDLALADERGAREAVRHRLAEGRQVGLDAVGRLRAAEVPAEAGDHLVEDEQRAVPRAQVAQALEEPRRRRDAALGLEHDTRDLPADGVEQGRGRVEIVVAGT